MPDIYEQPAAARPTSLAQRAREGLLALGQLNDARKAADELQVLRHACTFAEGIAERLGVARAVALELSDLGVPIRPKASEKIIGVRRHLRTTATVAEDPTVPLTERLRARATHDALTAAEAVAVEIEGALRRAVAQEGARVRPADLDELAATLPRGESVWARLSMLQRDFSEPPRATPLRELPGRVRRWREHADRWNETRSEALHALQRLHPEVQAFRRAAASEAGAPWSMVTPTVRDWLDTYGNDTGYRTRYVDGD